MTTTTSISMSIFIDIIFRFFDKDNSGGINPTELRNGLDMFGLQFDENEATAQYSFSIRSLLEGSGYDGSIRHHL